MKKLLAVLFTAMLTMALPAAAWAHGSDSTIVPGPSYEGQSGGATYQIAGAPAGTTLEISGGAVDVANVADQLNATFGTNATYVAGAVFDFNALLNGAAYKLPADAMLTIAFPVPSEYNGHRAQAVVIHDDGTTQTWSNLTVTNGSVTLSGIQGTSTAYIGITDEVVSGGANAGSTSPQTGVDFTGVALITGAAAVAACFAGITLRKKVTNK